MFKYLIIVIGLILNSPSVSSQVAGNNIIPTDSFKEIFNPADIKLNVNDFDKRIQSLVSRVVQNLSVDSSKPSVCNRDLLISLSSAIIKLPRGLHDEVLYLEGLTLEMCGKLDQAKSSYNKSLKLRRNNPLVLYRLASILIRKKNYNEAAIVIQEAEWQGFQEKYLLTFLKGVIRIAENNYDDAINLFQQSLFLNPHFLPTAKAQYRTRTEYRKLTKDPKIILQLEKDIPQDLARLVALQPNDISYLLPYVKHLLNAGNILRNPMKLTEGLTLVENQLKKSDAHFAEFALLKVQFLEKLNKTDELMKFLNELEENKKITPNLIAKKQMLLQDKLEE